MVAVRSWPRFGVLGVAAVVLIFASTCSPRQRASASRWHRNAAMSCLPERSALWAPRLVRLHGDPWPDLGGADAARLLAHLEWEEGGDADELRLPLDTANAPAITLDPVRGSVPPPLIQGEGSLADALPATVRPVSRDCAGWLQQLLLWATYERTSSNPPSGTNALAVFQLFLLCEVVKY